MENDDEVAVAEAAAVATKLPPPVEVICGDEPERRDERSKRLRALQDALKDAQGLAAQAEAIRARGKILRFGRDWTVARMDEVVIAVLVAVVCDRLSVGISRTLSRVVCPQRARGHLAKAQNEQQIQVAQARGRLRG